jgi:hypothetical protein
MVSTAGGTRPQPTLTTQPDTTAQAAVCGSADIAEVLLLWWHCSDTASTKQQHAHVGMLAQCALLIRVAHLYSVMSAFTCQSSSAVAAA